MVIRATSDLHLSDPTVDLVFAALGELRRDAEATGGYTVIAGDLFDQGDVVHMPTWNRLRDLLHGWPGDGVFVIVGNHDQYAGGGDCLRGLAGGGRSITRAHVVVVDRPTATPVGPMVPYVRPGLFAAAVAEAAAAAYDGLPPVLWCHQGFRGAYLNGMRRDRDGVPCRAIPEHLFTVAGHYHMPQNLGPLVYCGSPYERTFAEEGQRKGWLRWADVDADVVPVRVPFAFGAPRHFTVRWDPAVGPPPRPPATATDRVRVVTAATRRAASDAAAQLAASGLSGAPVVAAPEGAVARPAAGTDPRSAAEAWAAARFVEGAAGYDPSDMADLAEEEALWAHA